MKLTRIALSLTVALVMTASVRAGTIQFKSGGADDALAGYGQVISGDWHGLLQAFASGVPGVSDGQFWTICIEKDEDITYGTYDAVVKTEAVTGGEAVSDPLDPKTAWLFHAFNTGAVVVSSDADGVKLQEAFYALENEVVAPTAGSNAYYDQAIASTWSTIGAVRVLNLTKNGGLAQDVLVEIPEPATLALLGAGGLVLIRRRRERRGV